MNNNYIDLIESVSTLTLVPDAKYPLDAEEIEFLRSQPHDTAICELLERQLCNGWTDLTGTELFGGMILESPDGKVYFDNYYAVRSALDALLDGKTYTFYSVD
jgi:hypothetical protein